MVEREREREREREMYFVGVVPVSTQHGGCHKTTTIPIERALKTDIVAILVVCMNINIMKDIGLSRRYIITIPRSHDLRIFMVYVMVLRFGYIHGYEPSYSDILTFFLTPRGMKK